MGRPSRRSSFVGQPGGKFLWKKASPGAKPQTGMPTRAGGTGLLFLLFLPERSACLQRPGAVKGAPFLGAAKRTLEGEDRCDRIEQGGKD
jgi:hypothetical protein